MATHIDWFDSHCHLDLPELAGDASSHWRDAQALGVKRVLIPSVAPANWSHTATLASGLEGARYALGIHPWWLDGLSASPASLRAPLRQALASGASAVGETGLDGGIALPLSAQLPWLEMHLALAIEMDLPVILHAHKAHNLLIETLNRFPHARGVVHGFSGSAEQAEAFRRRGWLLGIGGVVTYARAVKTRATVAALPAGSFLLETDAPSMPLSGYQGQVNVPGRLLEVAECVAALRGETLTQLHAAVSAAEAALFGPAVTA